MVISVKNITILFVIVFFTATGCDNILDTKPQNTVSSATFWESKEDALSAVNGIYNYLPGINELRWDELSDIGLHNSPSGALTTLETGEQNAETSLIENLWDTHYQGIRRVNYFLENVDKVSENDPTFKDDLRKRLVAEAHVIRAYLYMRLSFWFGDIPLITKTLSVAEAKNVNETPKGEIVDFIGEELVQAAKDLPLSYTGNNIGRITKGAALGLKARAMLYNSRWQEAANAAKAVIDLDVYELYPSYKTLFSYNAQNNEEVILDRQYTKDDASNNFFAHYAPHGMNGNVGISPTRKLVDAYETKNGISIDDDPQYNKRDPYSNRDPRLDYTLFIPAFSDSNPGEALYNDKEYDPRPGSGTVDEMEVNYRRTKTGFNPQKYVNEEDINDRSNCGTNFILLRYADILLMYAEAKIELNQIDNNVYSAINEVRQRPDVDMPPIIQVKTQNEMRQIVRHERMVELAMEGLRYWDIIRWKIAEDILPGPIEGMDYIKSGENQIRTHIYRGVIRSFDSARDYLFPIPAQELILNPNLNQNPGY